jgi:hypothetical protein
VQCFESALLYDPIEFLYLKRILSWNWIQFQIKILPVPYLPVFHFNKILQLLDPDVGGTSEGTGFETFDRIKQVPGI